MVKYLIGMLMVFTLAIFTLTSCKKESLGDPDITGMTFREVIATGGSFTDPIENIQVTATDTSSYTTDNSVWTCTSQTLSVNAASGGNAGFPLLSPNAGVIYPGSMLQGNSLNSGNPNPIVVERAGGTISTDILDGNIQSTFEVDQVSKSSITNAINNIIATSTGTLPANFNIKIEHIQSREQFALALGVDINSTFVDLESKLNYRRDESKSTFMVSLNQSYYTMSFDLPTSLDKLFAPSVTPGDLALYVGENNPATYISDVTYGRIFYMLIESTSSQTDLEIAVNSAFNGVTVDVDATLDIDYFSELDQVTYSVFAYGGDAEPTFTAIGVTDIHTLKDVLKKSSSLGSAKPLSYVVRNVLDDKIVATQLATTYEEEDCRITEAVGTLPALRHWTGHSLFDSFGRVTAAYSEGDYSIILLNEQGQWLRSTYENGEGRLEGPFQLDNDFPLNSVGAACKYLGPDHNGILLLNANGTEFTFLNQSNGEWSAPKAMTNYPWGPVPFAASGVSAIAYAKYREPTVDNIGTRFGYSQMWFNAAGDHYARGYTNGLNRWAQVSKLTQDWGGGKLAGKIEQVGAATGFTLGDPNTGNHFYILFDRHKDQYVIYGNVNGTGDEAVGPFSL